MIISVHIGKTGGSSFKKILSEIYGDKLFFDYNKLRSRNIGILR